MADKKLSIKEEAKRAILDQGSYLLKVNGQNVIFTEENFDEFPSDADLALGNPELESLALEDIDAQMERLQAAKKKLEAAKKAEASEAKEAPAKAEAKKEESK